MQLPDLSGDRPVSQGEGLSPSTCYKTQAGKHVKLDPPLIFHRIENSDAGSSQTSYPAPMDQERAPKLLARWARNALDTQHYDLGLSH
jgi:hypothetical protein